jgi:hypothetical protein
MMRAQLSTASSAVNGGWSLALTSVILPIGRRQAAARAHDGPGNQIHAIVSNCYLSVAHGHVSRALFDDDASVRSSLHTALLLYSSTFLKPRNAGAWMRIKGKCSTSKRARPRACTASSSRSPSAPAVEPNLRCTGKKHESHKIGLTETCLYYQPNSSRVIINVVFQPFLYPCTAELKVVG